MANSELNLKKNIETLLQCFGEYISSPVSKIIINFARDPKCGDGDIISFSSGCNKKNLCVPITIHIGKCTINKWYCENCAKNFIQIIKFK
jgi:hypothetical protein